MSILRAMPGAHANRSCEPYENDGVFGPAPPLMPHAGAMLWRL